MPRASECLHIFLNFALAKGAHMSHLSDIEIAQQATLKPITEIADQIGLKQEDLIMYGDYKAKVKMTSLNRLMGEGKSGHLVLVSAMTPTKAGEGKTTTSIGLTQALKHIGKNAVVALREPSLGPCFGVKGGAAGGGYSQVLPMEDINLNFTGDMHAVTTAHNLISATVDNYIHAKNEKGLVPQQVTWRRVMDMNERALRNIVLALGGKTNGVPRESGFDITASSEIMAILCLSQSYSDLKKRIGNIYIGPTQDKSPFFARDLNVAGAATALLKEALMPNLVQTLENGPAFVHGGPFANIAQGANTITATKLAMKTADIAITEAGFGFDLGGEKFMDIVSPYGGFEPDAVVLVATIRALKLHGGMNFNDLTTSNPDAVRKGAPNLDKHIENLRKFNKKGVVCLNCFPTDTPEEINVVKEICDRAEIPVAVSTFWAEGGKGGVELAEQVMEVLEQPKQDLKQVYDWNMKPEEKIEAVAREIYGADGVSFQGKALKDLEKIYQNGFDKLPVCIAKTQNSLSDDASKLGRPEGYELTVREVFVSSGAGFLVPLTGDIMRMPGLPKVPAAEKIDIDDEGNISGLF